MRVPRRWWGDVDWGLVIAALGTGNHVRGRPRLIDRGTYEEDEESPASADLSRSA